LARVFCDLSLKTKELSQKTPEKSRKKLFTKPSHEKLRKEDHHGIANYRGVEFLQS